MGKIQIYIVDDEWMAVEYLKALLKEASPTYEVVGEAFHGYVAYEEILKLRPDIVFVDIQMPGMTGIELAEKIVGSECNPSVIFLTSYRDFDFVKKGMDLGIASYLLKNELTTELLKKEISKIMKDTEVERRKTYMYTSYNLKNFLFSGGEPLDMNKDKTSLERYAVILFVADRPVYLDGRKSDNIQTDVMEMEDMEYPKGLRCRHIIQIENGKWCAVFYIASTVSDSENILVESGKRIQDMFEKNGVFVSFFFDTSVKNILCIPAQFQKMNALSEQIFFYGKKSCINMRNVEVKEKEDVSAQIAALSYALDEEDKNAVCYLAENLLDLLAGNKNLPEYRRIIVEVSALLKRYCQRKKVEIPDIMEKTIFETHYEVKKWIIQCIVQIFNQLNAQREHQFSPAVGLATEYIVKNYQNNISVQDIAQAAGISAGHLRKCFKNEMDLTVVDYLTEYRIKKAKVLMEKREYKISEIYEKVGFTSSQYFSYVFKKTEGKTSSEYMKSI